MLEDSLKVAQIIESVITAAGIIVAAISGYIVFVRQREVFPKARTSHRLRYDRIAPDKALLTLDVTLHNPSKVRIILTSYRIRIMQILPAADELKEMLDNRILEQGKRGLKITQWHLLAEDSKRGTSESPADELEPGESLQIHRSFLIRDTAHVIQVESSFDNPARKGRSLEWEYTTVHNIPQQGG